MRPLVAQAVMPRRLRRRARRARGRRCGRGAAARGRQLARCLASPCRVPEDDPMAATQSEPSKTGPQPPLPCGHAARTRAARGSGRPRSTATPPGTRGVSLQGATPRQRGASAAYAGDACALTTASAPHSAVSARASRQRAAGNCNCAPPACPCARAAGPFTRGSCPPPTPPTSRCGRRAAEQSRTQRRKPAGRSPSRGIGESRGPVALRCPSAGAPGCGPA